MTPSDTLVPRWCRVRPRAISFRLADAEEALERLERLDRFPKSDAMGSLRVPVAEGDATAGCALGDLPSVAHGLLERAFSPAG